MLKSGEVECKLNQTLIITQDQRAALDKAEIPYNNGFGDKT